MGQYLVLSLFADRKPELGVRVISLANERAASAGVGAKNADAIDSDGLSGETIVEEKRGKERKREEERRIESQ